MFFEWSIVLYADSFSVWDPYFSAAVRSSQTQELKTESRIWKLKVAGIEKQQDDKKEAIG